MQIAIVACVFPPEPQVSGQIAWQLSEELARNATVTVVRPPPSRTEEKTCSVAPLKHPNVVVVTTDSFTSPRFSFLGRAAESASFGLKTAWVLAGSDCRWDAVYVNTWPVFAQAITCLFGRAWNVPIVIHIQDTYPEAITSRFSGKIVRCIEACLMRLDQWNVRSAEKVVVISDSMARYYVSTRGVREQCVTLCSNWQDPDLFNVGAERQRVESAYGLRSGRFNFVYVGNIGPAAGVEFLIRAYAAAAQPSSQLVIVGEGSCKRSCVELAESLGLSSITFISEPRLEKVGELHRLADVCLLPMTAGVGNHSVPSKFIAYLLAAKPILATVGRDSDLGRQIEKSGCGWVGEPEDVTWLSGQMRHVASLPRSVLERHSAAALRLGGERYSKRTQLQLLSASVRSCATAHKRDAVV